MAILCRSALAACLTVIGACLTLAALPVLTRTAVAEIATREGEYFLIGYSRETEPEAVALAEGLAVHYRTALVFAAANGWYAVGIGPYRMDDPDATLATEVAKGALPPDSFRTRGSRLERVVYTATWDETLAAADDAGEGRPGDFAVEDDRRWIVTFSRPTLPEARAIARSYLRARSDVHLFRAGNGQFAIAFGPSSEADATASLALNKALHRVPIDSFLTRGRSFTTEYAASGTSRSSVEAAALGRGAGCPDATVVPNRRYRLGPGECVRLLVTGSKTSLAVLTLHSPGAAGVTTAQLIKDDVPIAGGLTPVLAGCTGSEGPTVLVSNGPVGGAPAFALSSRADAGRPVDFTVHTVDLLDIRRLAVSVGRVAIQEVAKEILRYASGVTDHSPPGTSFKIDAAVNVMSVVLDAAAGANRCELAGSAAGAAISQALRERGFGSVLVSLGSEYAVGVLNDVFANAR